MIREFFTNTFSDPSRRWKHLLNFLIFALIAFWLLPSPTKPVSGLKVMTYNIRHGLGIDRELKPERIAAVINDFDPDIVVLNEVDMGTTRSNGIRDVDQLADMTDHFGYFARAIDFDSGQYGNALLSRWPISGGLQTWDISNQWTKEDRVLFRAIIPAEADTLQVFGTHLGLDPRERLLQAQFIDSILVKYQNDYPTILAGDFNCERTSPEYDILVHRLPDTYAFLNRSDIKTYPVPHPDRTIDYIFASLNWSGLQIVEPEIAVVDTASDHYPLQLILVP